MTVNPGRTRPIRQRSVSLAMAKTPAVVPKSRRPFDAKAYLESTGPARKVVKYRRGEVGFAQGDPANDVRYIQKGAIKISVLSRIGKEAVVAILSPGDFFGEGALAGQSIRIETATAMTPSSVLIIEKEAMVRLLHDEPLFADRFLSHMLTRNMRIEAAQGGSSERSHMPNDRVPPEEHRQQAEGVRERAEDRRQEAEQFRRFAEEAREVRDRHREALDLLREERERLREAAETARTAGEEARAAAEAARDAAMDAVQATAETLQATLENMKAVEEMRQTLRDIRDVNKLGSN